MKIKEGGVMNIQNIDLRRDDFEGMHPKAKLFGFDEDKKLYTGDGVESINDQWTTWCACIGMLCLDVKEAQAVPDLGELQERIAGHQYYHDEHGHMIVDMDDVVKEISGFDSWKSQAVPEKDAVIKKLSDQLYAQEMKASAARVLCETACELLDDYAHQDAMVILNDLEQAMKEPAND